MPRGIYSRSEETKQRLRIQQKGLKRTNEAKKKMRLAKLGKPTWNKGKKLFQLSKENACAWKGDKVGYRGAHVWITRWLGRPTKCEHCGKDGLMGHQIGWANKDHKYRRELTDWIRLCQKCHRKYDYEKFVICQTTK